MNPDALRKRRWNAQASRRTKPLLETWRLSPPDIFRTHHLRHRQATAASPGVKGGPFYTRLPCTKDVDVHLPPLCAVREPPAGAVAGSRLRTPAPVTGKCLLGIKPRSLRSTRRHRPCVFP